MKDTIYLIVDRKKVDRMVKTKRSALSLYKDEIPIKLTIEVPDENWKKPFLEKTIIVNRWDKGIDVDDIHFETDFVTEEEAEKIRQHRINKMKEILEQQGYRIEKTDR